MAEENTKTEDAKSPDTLDTQKENTSEDKTPTSKVEKPTEKKSDTHKEKTEYVPKEQFESVSKNLSAKDRELSQMRKEIESMKNRESVKDMLLESDLPEIVKTKLKTRIDTITPDSFQNEADTLLEVFEYGKNSFKEEQTRRVNTEPNKAEVTGLRQKLETASTKEDFKDLFNAVRS